MNSGELRDAIKSECFKLLQEIANIQDEVSLEYWLCEVVKLLENGARWTAFYAIPSLTPEEYNWVIEQDCIKQFLPLPAGSRLRKEHKRYNLAVQRGFKPGKDFYHDEKGDFQISEELASFWVLQGFYSG